MRAIIIEDEQLAARRLESMIKECEPEIEVVAVLESVCESVQWFKKNEPPDLIFLDIHLEDGVSFAIFEQVEVTSPIIFTTAFDEYAIKAFKLRSIDYLLKPIAQDDLQKAIEKYKDWGNNKKKLVDMSELFDMISGQNKKYRDRFCVSVGQKLKTIQADEIAYFFSVSGITFMVTKTRNQYSVDQSLDALSAELNPKHFFRVNRQYLTGLKSIANVHVFPKSRLKLELNPAAQDEVFVSIDKAPAFKKWLDGSE